MKTHRSVNWLVLVIVCVGTATSQQRHVDGALKLWELDEKGVRASLDSQLSNFKVDVNSTILISPDGTALRSIVNNNGAYLEPRAVLPATLHAQRSALLELLAEITQQVELAKRLMTIMADPRLMQADSARARLYEALVQDARTFDRLDMRRSKTLSTYLQAMGYDEKYILQLKDNAYPRNGNYDAMASFLRREIARMDSTIVRGAQSVFDQASSFTLSLGAVLVKNGKRSPIHLPGYDTNESGIPHKIEKVSFDLTPQQEQQLRSDYDFAQKVSDLVNNLRNQKDLSVTMIFDQNRVLMQSVDSLVANVASFQSVVLAQIESKIQVTKATVVASNDPRLATLNLDISQLLNEVSKMKKLVDSAFSTIRAWKDEIERTPSTTDAVTLLRTTLDKLQSSAAFLDGLGRNFVLEAKTIERLFDDCLKEGGKVGAETVKDALSSARSLLVDTPIARTVQRIIADLQATIGIAPSLRVAAGQVTVVNGIGADILQSPAHLRKRLDNVASTELNLLSTDREEGDYVQLTMAVSERANLIAERNILFEIRKFGWVSGVTANAVFISALPKDYRDQVRFQMAPVATFYVRWQPRSLTYSPIGFGIHTVTLQFDPDVPIELGIGGSIHLINDLLQFGFGANLHAHGRPGYWYLGLGIMDVLNAVRGK